MDAQPTPSPSQRWRLALFPLALVLFIIVPFVLFGAWFDATVAWLAANAGPWGLAALIVATLASDVILPVPSSVVSLLAGTALGVVWGTVCTFLGMTLGTIVGYGIGRAGGAPLARAVAGSANFEKMQAFTDRWGWIGIVLFRPVPVLAEFSVLAAGSARLDPVPLLAAAIPANLGVALAYAAAGAWLGQEPSLALPLLGGVLLFAVCALLVKFVTKARALARQTQA